MESKKLWVSLLLLVGSASLSAGCNNATSCDDCVGIGTDCYWCEDKQTCNEGGVDGFEAKCSMCGSDSECKKETCLVNAKLLWIIVPSVSAGVLLIIIVTIWWCCRSRKKKALKTYEYKENKKDEEKRNAREARRAERDAERNSRREDIRAKYGLGKPKTDDDYNAGMMEDQS